MPKPLSTSKFDWRNSRKWRERMQGTQDITANCAERQSLLQKRVHSSAHPDQDRPELAIRSTIHSENRSPATRMETAATETKDCDGAHNILA